MLTKLPDHAPRRFNSVDGLTVTIKQGLYRDYEMGDVSEAFAKVRARLDGRAPTEACSQWLQSHRSQLSRFSKDIVAGYAEKYRSNSNINYSDELTFLMYDNAYFYYNLYKTLIASRYIEEALSNRPLQSIDLGCGVGTFSLSLSLMDRRHNSSYVLVDYGALQLRVAQCLMPMFNIDVSRYMQANALNLFHIRGLRCGAYWLCGNSEIYKIEPSAISRSFRDGFVLIDYEDRLNEFARYVGRHVRQLERITLRCESDAYIFEQLGRKNVEVHILAGVGSA